MKDEEGLTCLHYAVQSGSFEMVQLLLEKQADAFAQSSMGYTVIHYAIQRGNVQLLAFFYYKLCLDFEIRDVMDKTPFLFAVELESEHYIS